MTRWSTLRSTYTYWLLTREQLLRVKWASLESMTALEMSSRMIKSPLRAISIYENTHLVVSSSYLPFFISKGTGRRMIYNINTSLLPAVVAPQRRLYTRTNRFSLQFSDPAWRRESYTLLSTTPCKLAYFKPCRFTQLQQYNHFNPHDPDVNRVKGSLDATYQDAIPLKNIDLYLGEVEISLDGIIHPEIACWWDNPEL